MIFFQVKTAKPGYYDLNLKYREIPDPDDCSGNLCPEGSVCVDGHFSYTCKCDSDSCHPCLNARCMTYGFCLYDDHAGPCTCSDTSLEIPSCTENNYSKYFLTQYISADVFALKFSRLYSGSRSKVCVSGIGFSHQIKGHSIKHSLTIFSCT